MKVSKNAQRKMNSTRPSKKYLPQILKSLHNPNVMKVGDHIFDNGTVVPIFEVSDYRALNQVIGYAKFLNTNYGDVFYRGEVHLHKTLLPSISRKTNINQCTFQLNQAIDSAITDEKFSKTAKLSGFKGRQTPRLIVEAMLQHYGYSTHFIDLVDNHWVALWFGLNRFKKMQSLSTYYYYQSRQVNPVELIGLNEITNELYQYMLLVAVDNNAAPVERGIYIGNDTIVIDLRSSLPSVLLRPHKAIICKIKVALNLDCLRFKAVFLFRLQREVFSLSHARFVVSMVRLYTTKVEGNQCLDTRQWIESNVLFCRMSASVAGCTHSFRLLPIG